MGLWRALVGGAAVVTAVVAACGPSGELAVDGRRALARVVHQVEAGQRIPGTEGHARVRDWIAAELTRLGATVEMQSFIDSTLGKPLELVNVIGRFGVGGGAEDRGPLVLGAHYDTRPWADRDPDPARRGDPVPGANDGASGVAVLLEVAELLSRRAPACEVHLVFFDGEDQGHPESAEGFALGARGYARRLPSPKPAAAFVFDMVGDHQLLIHPEVGSHEHASSLVRAVLDGARATGARSFREEPRFRLTDDHVPLQEAGVPAALVIDFDYPAWHTHRDLPDQVAAESLAEVSRVAAWLVYAGPYCRHP